MRRRYDRCVSLRFRNSAEDHSRRAEPFPYFPCKSGGLLEAPAFEPPSAARPGVQSDERRASERRGPSASPLPRFFRNRQERPFHRRRKLEHPVEDLIVAALVHPLDFIGSGYPA